MDRVLLLTGDMFLLLGLCEIFLVQFDKNFLLLCLDLPMLYVDPSPCLPKCALYDTGF
jgi:hypothetical protein